MTMVTKERATGSITFLAAVVPIGMLSYTFFQIDLMASWYTFLTFSLFLFVSITALLYVVWTNFGKKELNELEKLDYDVKLLKKQIELESLKNQFKDAPADFSTNLGDGTSENPIKLTSKDIMSGVDEIYKVLREKFGRIEVVDKRKWDTGKVMMEVKIVKDGTIRQVYFQKSAEAMSARSRLPTQQEILNSQENMIKEIEEQKKLHEKEENNLTGE